MSPTVQFVMTDVCMSMGHTGLTELINKEKKANAFFNRAMDKDDALVLFVNKARTACKLYSPNNWVVAHLKLRHGVRVSNLLVHVIPKSFGGSIELTRSVEKALMVLNKLEKAA